MRFIWTSYDYVSPKDTYYPDIVVGGIADVRMYDYPVGPKPALKWTIRSVYSV